MSPSPNLQTVTLGPGGPSVAALGIGTWAWGDSLFWDYGKAYGEGDLEAAFGAALEAGTALFDTAEIYGFGESERLLGRFMQRRPGQAIAATKYFPLPWRFSGQAVRDALTASLDRLQVASVALYQVHWPLDFLLSQKDLMQALAAEVKAGRIGAVGVSNYSAQQMRQAHGYLAAQGVPLAVNQVQYSLLHRHPETNGVIDVARELGVTVLAYSPLAQGLLTGKYTSDTNLKPAGARVLSPRFSQNQLGQLMPLIRALQDIGERRDRTPAQVALNWLVAQGNVLPIPGAKNARQAAQNAGALGWALSEEEVDRLSQLTQRYR
jgi:aryl-alcohol dehydrogenase-like predicted oxidoreductase